MLNQLKQTFAKIIDIIQHYLFRKRTLNYIIWILIVAIIAELKAISKYEAINAFLRELVNDTENSKIWLKYTILICEILFDNGSPFVLTVLTLLLLLIIYLRFYEIKNLQVSGSDKPDEFKNELILNVQKNIKESKILKNDEYVKLNKLLADQNLKNNLKIYHFFKRERGNVYKLEQFVKESNLIEDLNKEII